jgi:anti-sigma B factor antagonist
MTVRAGHIAGERAAPDGGTGAMGAIATDLARAGDGTTRGQLEFQYQRAADGHAMVCVRGELDIATAAQAHACLRAALDSEKKGKVTLNLADLTFCDAAGLGVLARVAGEARRTGRTVRLAAPRPALVRIMRITGMDAAFPEVRTPLLTMVPEPRQSAAAAELPAGRRCHPLLLARRARGLPGQLCDLVSLTHGDRAPAELDWDCAREKAAELPAEGRGR